MNRQLCHVFLAAAFGAGGCFHAPHVCLTPPYDAPGGFSETYHEAVFQNAEIFGGREVLISEGSTTVGPPILVWPSFKTSAEPPMEW